MFSDKQQPKNYCKKYIPKGFFSFVAFVSFVVILYSWLHGLA